MSSARSFVLVAVVAGGCTSLLGLDDVTGDRDGDRIANERDVCPDDYDPLQRDQDGDGIGDACDECRVLTHDLDGDGRDDFCDACVGPGPSGVDSDADGIDDGCDTCVGGISTISLDLDEDGELDGCDACIGNGLDRDRDNIDDACDACLFGPPHDEDGDGIYDACDVCPADPDPGQELSGDAVGVACDPDVSTKNARRLFDGFGVDDPGIWAPLAGWSVVDDTMMPPETPDTVRGSFRKVRGDFTIRVRLHFGPEIVKSTLGIDAYGNFGIRVENPRCMISSDGELSNDFGSVSKRIDVNGGVELTMQRRAGTETQTECVAIARNGETVKVTELGAGFDLRVRLYANGATGGFEWIDAIDQPPE